MSDLNKAIAKVAKENPEFARLLKAELSKTAGGYTTPLKSGAKVGPRQIKALVHKSNEFTREFLDQIDWSKIDWEPPDPISRNLTGYEGAHTLWRAFKEGEYGNRQSNYLWGYVFAGTSVARGGQVEVVSYLYLKL